MFKKKKKKTVLVSGPFNATVCQITGLTMHLTMAKKTSKRPWHWFKDSLRYLFLLFTNVASDYCVGGFCTVVNQWLTVCSQNTHSYLLRGCRDVVGVEGLKKTERQRETARERERETVALSLSQHLSFPHNMKPESIPTSRALDPEYSCWWHFTMCRRWGFAEIRKCVWRDWSLLPLSLFAPCLTESTLTQTTQSNLKINK